MTELDRLKIELYELAEEEAGLWERLRKVQDIISDRKQKLNDLRANEAGEQGEQ